LLEIAMFDQPLCHRTAEEELSHRVLETEISVSANCSPEEFERQTEPADAMTQLCSPSLEFFPGTEEWISTMMLEQGAQTLSPAPDLIPS